MSKNTLQFALGGAALLIIFLLFNRKPCVCSGLVPTPEGEN